MKTYDVLLSKVESAKVQIEAENAEEAEGIAFERFMHREIELGDSGILPGEVNIVVSEAGAQQFSSPGMIPIYWSDLIPAKQFEILTAFGANYNYDELPIIEIPIR